MNPYLLVLGLGLAALVQVSLMPAFAVRGVTPNLVLVIVVGWALMHRTRSALSWGLVGGLWLDALGSGPLGMYTAGLLAAAVVAGQVGAVLHTASPLLPLLLAALGTLAADLVHMAVLAASGHGLPSVDVVVRLVGLEMAVNLVLMAPAFPLLVALSRRVGQERLPLE